MSLRPASSSLAALALVSSSALVLASDPSPGKAAPVSWDAGPGAKVSFKGLPGASPLASASLPELHTAELPDARVALRQGLRHPGTGPDHQGTSIFALCLRAPGLNLPPDVDDLAFSKMNARIEAELQRDGAQTDQFSPGRVVEQGHLLRMPFSGEATPPKGRPGVKNRILGKNFVGFLGEPPEILLCSVGCLETSTSASAACGPVIESVALSGAFIAPPRPGVLARGAFAVARRPLAAVGLLFGLVLVALGAAVAFWPSRPAPPTS